MRSELVASLLSAILARQPPLEAPEPVEPPPSPAAAAPSTAPAPVTAPTTAPASEETSGPPASVPADAPAPEPAPTEDPLADARARFSRAAEHYQLGRYAEAIAIFEALYRETQETPLLFNLGQAHWKRYNLEPDVRHLRTAKTMFENYDRAMTGQAGYDGREADGYLRALTAQIAGIEASQHAGLQPRGPDPRLLETDRQRQVARGLAATGVTLTVLGSLSALLATVGGALRISADVTLDNAGGSEPGKSNPHSAEDDRRLRDMYLTGGQLAFSGLVGAAALLPVGIALLVTGRLRGKRLARPPVSLGARGGVIGVRF